MLEKAECCDLKYLIQLRLICQNIPLITESCSRGHWGEVVYHNLQVDLTPLPI